MLRILSFLLLVFSLSIAEAAPVTTGADNFFDQKLHTKLKGKRIGLVTNQAALNRNFDSTADLFKKHQGKDYTLAAIFGPEHGYDGSAPADEHVSSWMEGTLPIYSLYGPARRPSHEMLQGIDLLVVDLMDIGVRTYTYVSTMCYVMEEAAKHNIPLILLDRPNPINGITVDGPPLELKHRSFIGYLEVPYCHGMTMGELAQFHNQENKIGCQLKVIPMKNWKRQMTFTDTGLPWTSLSPYIPEPTTPLYYPLTNLLPDLITSINHGIGYTLPFKILGSPWIDANLFSKKIKECCLPGITAIPIHYRPLAGGYRNKTCHGVQLIITDHLTYKPFYTQLILLQVLKELYPQRVNDSLEKIKAKCGTLKCIIGQTATIDAIISQKLTGTDVVPFYRSQLESFIARRKPYLNPAYTEKVKKI
jgi:uncharacterized protein YbbC (DUF1343 family)